MVLQLAFAAFVFHLFHTLWVVNIWFIVGFLVLTLAAWVLLLFVPRVGFLYVLAVCIVLWRMTFDTFPPCAASVRIQYFVLTIPRNRERFLKLEKRLNDAQIAFEALSGVDATTERVTPPKGAHLGNYVFMLGFQRAMLAMLARSNKETEWVVILEDDAYFYDWSFQGIAGAACHYKSADMIWLDMRGAPDWFFLKQCRGGMAGSLFRRSSLEKIAKLMDVNSDAFQASLDSYNPTGKNDDFLAHMCNTGVIKCALSPMVRESGDKSSHITTKS